MIFRKIHIRGQLVAYFEKLPSACREAGRITAYAVLLLNEGVWDWGGGM